MYIALGYRSGGHAFLPGAFRACRAFLAVMRGFGIWRKLARPLGCFSGLGAFAAFCLKRWQGGAREGC